MKRSVLSKRRRPSGYSGTGAPVIVVATRLQLRGWRNLRRFFRLNGDIKAQLREEPGVVRYRRRALRSVAVLHAVHLAGRRGPRRLREIRCPSALDGCLRRDRRSRRLGVPTLGGAGAEIPDLVRGQGSPRRGRHALIEPAVPSRGGSWQRVLRAFRSPIATPRRSSVGRSRAQSSRVGARPGPALLGAGIYCGFP